MRKSTERIILHCTATIEGKDYSVDTIRQWHLQRKFDDIGYHFVIARDGEIMEGRDINKAGAHAAGYNYNSIGISYVGGLDKNLQPKDTRTPEQIEAFKTIIERMVDKYPSIRVLIGHRDTSPDLNESRSIEPHEYIKACPCFDVEKEYGVWFRELLQKKGVDKSEIDKGYDLLAQQRIDATKKKLR